MIQGCYPHPAALWTVVVVVLSPLWHLFCVGWFSPPPTHCGPCGSGGPVHVVPLLPLWLLRSWCSCERQPVRYCPLYGTDSKAVRCLFSTLRHKGAGGPYTRTWSVGHHALVFGHVTALAGNSTVWYLCCAGDSPPPVVLVVY